MPTLMTMGNSEGERRCDARCYDATGPECDCICGGMNHGKGLKAATENTCEHGKMLLEKIKREHPEQSGVINAIQQTLF